MEALNQIVLPTTEAAKALLVEKKTEKKETSNSTSGSSTNTSKNEVDTLQTILKNSKRIAGADRYETSVNISKKFFKKADNVVLASGENNADALVASSFADIKKASILLTKKSVLPNTVLVESS